eukprot:2303591-Amphidinium_carterae.3
MVEDGDALPKMITEFYNTGEAECCEQRGRASTLVLRYSGLPKSFTDAGGALMHALESLEETQSLGATSQVPVVMALT